MQTPLRQRQPLKYEREISTSAERQNTEKTKNNETRRERENKLKTKKRPNNENKNNLVLVWKKYIWHFRNLIQLF